MENIEEIEINISKVKDLLNYLIEQEYAIDITKNKYESVKIANYYLKETYHTTSMFLDVIFDYIRDIHEDITQYLDRVAKKR